MKETRKSLREQRDEARRLLAQAQETIARRDERWEVVLDAMLGDEQSKVLAIRLMEQLGIDYSKVEPAIKAALQLLHRSHREFVISRHFGSVEVAIREARRSFGMRNMARFDDGPYSAAYSHTHERYLRERTIEFSCLVVEPKEQIDPNETMRMLHESLNRAGAVTANEVRRREGLPELCDCGHAQHVGACHARDCRCLVERVEGAPLK